MSKRDDQFKVVEEAVNTFGRLDVFVHKAGIDVVTPFLDVDEQQLTRVFSINVNWVVFGTQAAAEQFIKQKSKGNIFNTCSIAGYEPYEMWSTYSATKHAVKSFTHSSVKELAKHDIRVNAYCLGVAATAMWDRIDEEMVKHYDHMQPGDAFKQFSGNILLGRPQEPEDVANLVSFLASDDADYITGKAFVTDGGLVFK